MYQYFYLTMIVATILAGIISITSSVIGKRPTRIWRHIMYGLMAIAVVSLIGFAISLI